jgi:hypothetical protein
MRSCDRASPPWFAIYNFFVWDPYRNQHHHHKDRGSAPCDGSSGRWKRCRPHNRYMRWSCWHRNTYMECIDVLTSLGGLQNRSAGCVPLGRLLPSRDTEGPIHSPLTHSYYFRFQVSKCKDDAALFDCELRVIVSVYTRMALKKLAYGAASISFLISYLFSFKPDHDTRFE